MEPLAERLEPVIAEATARGIARWVVNGTCPDDWAAVAALAADDPSRKIPAFGVHPWRAASLEGGWLEMLDGFLKEHPYAGVGEIGLDRWVKDPPIGIQIPVFEAQWRRAVELGRPVTVHCLRAWDDLLASLRHLPPHPGRVLVHAFGGPDEVGRELMEMGCLFSFNGNFLKRGKERLLEWWRQLPEDRLLIESDAPSMGPPAIYREGLPDLPDGANHPASMVACAEALARLRGVDSGHLQEVLARNFSRWWGGGA